MVEKIKLLFPGDKNMERIKKVHSWFNDPVLHIHKKRGGYFIYQKGLYLWSMGIKSIEDNEKIMKDFALNYPQETISIQDKEIKWLVLNRSSMVIHHNKLFIK